MHLESSGIKDIAVPDESSYNCFRQYTVWHTGLIIEANSYYLVELCARAMPQYKIPTLLTAL